MLPPVTAIEVRDGSERTLPVPVASSVGYNVLANEVKPESVSEEPPLTSKLALAALVIVGKDSDTPPLMRNVVFSASVRAGNWCAPPLTFSVPPLKLRVPPVKVARSETSRMLVALLLSRSTEPVIWVTSGISRSPPEKASTLVPPPVTAIEARDGSESRLPVPVASSVGYNVLVNEVKPESVSEEPPLTSKLALAALVIVGKDSDTPPLIRNVVLFGIGQRRQLMRPTTDIQRTAAKI